MKFYKKVLNNGIVVIMEKRDTPVVSFSITNKFGAAFEESKIKGIAHFIEHLVFTGTKTRSHEDISREIEKKGGILNAFTSHEVTSFWFKLPSEHVFAGADIIVDMLKNPLFDKEKFEKEKKVILEEIKMYHDNPRNAVSEQIEKNLYESPFGDLVIGNEKSINSLDRDFVFNYYKKVYSPENYVVCVVGDCDFDALCNYIDKNFVAGKRNLEIKKIVKKNAESFEEREGIDQAHLVFAVHAPMPNEKEFNVLEVLDAYLANGMSSRLFLEIREKRGLAYAVKSGMNSEKSYSYYSIYVGTTKKALDEVKKIIISEFKAIKDMKEEDLKEAKERVIGLKKVNSEEGSSVMNELVFYELSGDAKDYYGYEKRINSVNLKEVKELAVELIKSYSSAIIAPK